MLPDFVMEAIQRVSIRNKDFQTHMTTHPSEAFWENDYLLRRSTVHQLPRKVFERY